MTTYDLPRNERDDPERRTAWLEPDFCPAAYQGMLQMQDERAEADHSMAALAIIVTVGICGLMGGTVALVAPEHRLLVAGGVLLVGGFLWANRRLLAGQPGSIEP